MRRREFLALCKSEMESVALQFNIRLAWRRGDRDVIRVAFQNETTGIVFHLEVRDVHVFLEVSRLVAGEIPAFPRPVRSDSVISCFDFDYVLLIRCPDSILPACNEELIAIDEQVRRQVANLRQYGSDLLKGDFSVFTELDKLVKNRAREADFEQFGERAREFGWK
jgi:hypothetical protein